MPPKQAVAGASYVEVMIAGRTIRGTITVDGFPKDQATFNRVSGYVEQVPPSIGICYMRKHDMRHHRNQCQTLKSTRTLGMPDDVTREWSAIW